MRRIRISTLLLLIVIIALGMTLVQQQYATLRQQRQAAAREAELLVRLQATEMRAVYQEKLMHEMANKAQGGR